MQGLKRYVLFKKVNLPQPESPLVCFTLTVDGRSRLCVIDYSDYTPIDESHADKALVYFKMQYALEGYGRSNVIPGGYIPNDVNLYRYLPRLRRIADRRESKYDVYGRFSLSFATEVRRKALFELTNQNKFLFEGSAQRMRYSRFLREAAESKICIDLPGNGDFCFRLIDYLAVGACIVGPRHGCLLHKPLEDGVHLAYCEPDLSNLVELCEHYLAQPEKRERMRVESREYFDRYLRPEQLAAYYLSNCFSRIET